MIDQSRHHATAAGRSRIRTVLVIRGSEMVDVFTIEEQQACAEVEERDLADRQELMAKIAWLRTRQIKFRSHPQRVPSRREVRRFRDRTLLRLQGTGIPRKPGKPGPWFKPVNVATLKTARAELLHRVLTDPAPNLIPLHPSDAPTTTDAPARGPNGRFPDQPSTGTRPKIYAPLGAAVAA